MMNKNINDANQSLTTSQQQMPSQSPSKAAVERLSPRRSLGGQVRGGQEPGRGYSVTELTKGIFHIIQHHSQQ